MEQKNSIVVIYCLVKGQKKGWIEILPRIKSNIL